MEKSFRINEYRCQALTYDAAGMPVVFLHGLSYTMNIWQQIGVTDLLLEKHLPFLALDMPYGIKSNCQPRTRNVEKNTSFIAEAVKNAFGSRIPLVVGASIGGNIALWYASKFPVKGLLLIAPSRSLDEETLIHTYQNFNFPVRIIWGTYDTIISGEEMRTLSSKMPNSKFLVYQGAGHSAYRDQPEQFKHDLLELYAKAE